MGLRDYFENDLTNFDFNTNLSAIEPWASHYADDTDIPRMKEGRVGGQVRIPDQLTILSPFLL